MIITDLGKFVKLSTLVPRLIYKDMIHLEYQVKEILKMFKKTEATKLVKEQVRKEHPGIKGLKVKWVEYAETTYPTGKKGTYGFCAILANGYVPRGFLFEIDNNGGYWRAFQCNKAMNKIAKML